MSEFGVAGFDWDGGNWPKCAKHGLTKSEIESVFVNGPSVYPNLDHSQIEVRSMAIGKNDEGRYIYISFTIRKKEGVDRIRPVSARYMHRKEIERYEQR